MSEYEHGKLYYADSFFGTGELFYYDTRIKRNDDAVGPGGGFKPPGGLSYFWPEQLSNIRPAIVLDARDALFVSDALDTYTAQPWPDDMGDEVEGQATEIKVKIRDQLAKPKPEEPTAFGALVRARRSNRSTSTLWVRMPGAGSLVWLPQAMHGLADWDDLTDIEILSEGVTD